MSQKLTNRIIETANDDNIHQPPFTITKFAFTTRKIIYAISTSLDTLLFPDTMHSIRWEHLNYFRPMKPFKILSGERQRRKRRREREREKRKHREARREYEIQSLFSNRIFVVVGNRRILRFNNENHRPPPPFSEYLFIKESSRQSQSAPHANLSHLSLVHRSLIHFFVAQQFFGMENFNGKEIKWENEISGFSVVDRMIKR